MSSNLPVDVLQIILEYVDKADLLTLCRVNKVCCSCSRDILYRNICADRFPHLKVFGTLARATHLAKRVRSLYAVYYYLDSIIDIPYNLAKAMRNMSSLRSLELYVRSRYSILDGCTFKLDSFITDRPCDEYLRNFLNSQPTLTHVELRHNTTDDVQDEFETTCLPNLTRVAAELPLLQRLIPGRPLSEVNVIWYPGYLIPSIDFFTLSTAPIQKLTMTSCFIHTIPFEFLASIFPSLTHLSICLEQELSLDFVTQQKYEWIENLLAALDSLRVFDINFGEVDSILDIVLDENDGDFRGDYLPIITKAPPRLQYVAIYDGEYHYWKRVCGEWVVCEESECHRV